MGVIAKWLTADYPVPQILFFRSLFVLVPALALVAVWRRPALLRTAYPVGHLWRGLVGTASMFCIFYAYQMLPLADATAVGVMGPVFATLFAVVLLREPALRRHWIALGSGLAGGLVMIQPGGGGANWQGLGVALGGALLSGLAHTHIRRLGRTEAALTTVIYFALFATVVTAVLLPWNWRTPSCGDLVLLTLTGISAFVGQIFLAKAYRVAAAATLGPYNYTGLIWAAAFGYALWGEVPTPHILWGAVIVMAAGTYLAWGEGQRRPA